VPCPHAVDEKTTMPVTDELTVALAFGVFDDC
jgi:hypothetical protein